MDQKKDSKSEMPWDESSCDVRGCNYPNRPIRAEEYTRSELAIMANADCRFLDPDTRILLERE
ncbi:hypothetical protein IT407_03345 [Candidatus Uhrbacteria bacterium]|nr:hypothetical protein [Candidatus Uhrbacteria bacterium]